jgi:PEP-CTERM motif
LTRSIPFQPPPRLVYRRPKAGYRAVNFKLLFNTCETLRNEAQRLLVRGFILFKNSFRMGALALGAILVSSAASAVTIDTFNFTFSTGWMRRNPPGAPVADPGASLVGSFVGVVEPDALGTIALADLTSFVASFTDSEEFGIGGATLLSGLSTLSSFNFETLGGAGTFSFGQSMSPGSGKSAACAGFFSLLSDFSCSFLAQDTPGENAFILAHVLGVPYAFTADLPTITLVSSVTTAVPEPGSWALFGIGVVSIALIRRRKTRTDASARDRWRAIIRPA